MKDYEVEFPGVEVKLGKDFYVIPPLNLLSIERFEDRFANMSSLSLVKQISLMVDIIHCAALRNYPELSREKMGELLDINNVGQIFNVVMASSGMFSPEGQSDGNKEDGEKKE